MVAMMLIELLVTLIVTTMKKTRTLVILCILWILFALATFIPLVLSQNIAFGQTSPDNTRVPPSPNITIHSLPTPLPLPAIWTLGKPSPTHPGFFYVLRSGIQLGDAQASQIAYCGGSVWAFGRSKLWYKYISGSGSNTIWQLGTAVIPCDLKISTQSLFLGWNDNTDLENPDAVIPVAFRIYKNDAVLADVPWPITTYEDKLGIVNSTPGMKVCYQVNAIGKVADSGKTPYSCWTVE